MLVLPYINMNLPEVYTCSSFWTLLPSHIFYLKKILPQPIFPSHPLLSLATSSCCSIVLYIANQGFWKKVKLLSLVRLFATPWTAAYQVPPSTGFSRQEYWSGLPFPFPGDLPNPGIEPGFPALKVDSLPAEPPGKPIIISTVAPFFHLRLLRITE